MRKRRRKKSNELKVIWEYDKDMPEEEKQRRLGKVFEILLKMLTILEWKWYNYKKFLNSFTAWSLK